MLKYGKDTGLPETYRITLAISVAFLAHTLFMAAFPFSLPEHNHNPITVSVQLMPQGSAPSAASAPSQSSPPVLATPFTLEESPAQQQRSMPATSSPQPRSVTESDRDKTSPTEAVSKETTPLPDKKSPAIEAERTAQPRQQNAPSAVAPASAPSMAGQQSAKQGKSQQELTLKSKAPSEESSYLSLLVQTIARNAKIPKLEEFEKGQVLSVELELNLMSNGALVGARITESSGHDGLDQRVYRAALAASPYPEPPSSATRQQRFRVEVKYTF
jgi:protein TonB